MAARKKRPAPKKKAAATKASQDLGTLADQLYTKRAARLKLAAKVDLMKLDESALQFAIVRSLAKLRLTKASGKKATVSNTIVSIAQVDDWPVFEKWLLKNKDLAVLGRKLSQKHINELREAGKAPDGLKYAKINKLSVTKS